MKSKMQRDVNWKEILYLACLCTYIIISTLVGEGSILTYIPLVKWEHYIAFINMIKALLVLKMIFDIAEEPRMIFLIAITETIGFMVYTHNPTDVFLSMALWFLCAGKNVRARKITECLFGSHLVSFIILESLCAAGIVPLGKTIKSGHLVASYSLGFSHPNTAASKILQLVLLFWLLRKGRLRLVHYLGIIITMVFVKTVTDCSTVVLLLGLLLICTVLYNKRGVTQFLYRKITVVRNLFLAGYLGVLGITTVFVCLCKDGEIFKKLFGTFGARIAEAVKYYQYYGFSLWGQPLMYYKSDPKEAEKAGLYTLDNGYMYLLLGFGIVLFLYFIFLHAGTLWWIFERRRLDYVIVYGIFFIYGFLETLVIRTGMNFTLFYLFGFIWEYYDRRKQVENSRSRRLWQKN